MVNEKIQVLLHEPSGQPFSMLAIETISEILGWLPVKDRVVASSTCKIWHSAAFSAHHIWNEITYSSELFRTPLALTKMLEYSGECPIFLEVTIDNDNWTTVCTNVGLTMHRVTRLDINLEADLHFDVQLGVIEALATPAPLLRMFWLEDPYDALEDLGIEGHELFDDEAPRLKAVVLGRDIQTIDPQYNRVFHNTHRVMIHPARGWSAGTITHTFELFPNIKQLMAQIDVWHNDDPFDQSIELPKSLEIIEAFASRSAGRASNFLDCIPWEKVPRVITEFSTDEATEDAICNFFRATNPTLLQDACETNQLSIASILCINWPLSAPIRTSSSVMVHIFEGTDELWDLVPLSHTPKVDPRLYQSEFCYMFQQHCPALSQKQLQP